MSNIAYQRLHSFVAFTLPFTKREYSLHSPTRINTAKSMQICFWDTKTEWVFVTFLAVGIGVMTAFDRMEPRDGGSGRFCKWVPWCTARRRHLRWVGRRWVIEKPMLERKPALLQHFFFNSLEMETQIWSEVDCVIAPLTAEAISWPVLLPITLKYINQKVACITLLMDISMDATVF